jgi:hypothetical protein
MTRPLRDPRRQYRPRLTRDAIVAVALDVVRADGSTP